MPRLKKRTDLVFTALRVPIDIAMLLCAGMVAYSLRFDTLQDLRPIATEIALPDYFVYLGEGIVVFLVLFALSGLYSTHFRRFGREVASIITACSASITVVIVGIFFARELLTSRFIVLAVWLLSIVFVVLGRALLRTAHSLFLRAGVGLQYVAIIGEGKNAEHVRKELVESRSLGYAVVGTFSSFDAKTTAALDTLTAQHRLDDLILMDATVSHETFQAIMDYADVHHLGLRYSADIIGDKNLEIDTLAGIPMVEITRTKLAGWGRIFKRAFDIMAGTALFILCLPLMALIALAIRLESPGGAVYKNQRVGQRRLFNTYKFRTMYIEYCTGPGYDTSGEADKLENTLIKEKSERAGPVFKILDDPRRTKVGKFLEKTSLDELPQLVNVIRGTMSLVGPRPHMPKEVAGYKTHHHQLFSVKPGVTGLAQISGRSDLDFEDEAKLDIYYAEHWSPWLDFVILLKTPLAVISRKSRV